MFSHNTFAVLTVCTGNIARSPLTEQLLSARLTSAADVFTVTSAGTEAVVDGAMTPEAASLSRKFGGEPAEHRGRAITADMIDTADLVVTATRAHRSAVVALLPRASRYTFTVRQFARLLDSLDASTLAPSDESLVERAARLVGEVAAQRGFVAPLAQASDDDIEDPYRQSDELYDSVGEQIDEATARIASALLSETENTNEAVRHGA